MTKDFEPELAGTIWQPVVEAMTQEAKSFTPGEYVSIVFTTRKSKLAGNDRPHLYLMGSPESLQIGEDLRTFQVSVATEYLAGKDIHWAQEQFLGAGLFPNEGNVLFRVNSRTLNIDQLPSVITLTLDAMGKVFGIDKSSVIDPMPGSGLEDRLMSSHKLAMFGGYSLRLKGTGRKFTFSAQEIMAFFGFQLVDDNRN
jgi:hypothetical protein